MRRRGCGRGIGRAIGLEVTLHGEGRGSPKPNPPQVSLSLEVTLNGITAQSSRSGTAFHYYDAHISHVRRRGVGAS